MPDEKRFYDPEYCQFLEDKVRRYKASFIPSGPGHTSHGEYRLGKDTARLLRRKALGLYK